MDCKFRVMNCDDINEVYEIECLSFSTPWSIDSFYREINENKLALYNVIELDGKIIAYGGMWIVIDESHVTNIAVLPEFRGRGMGNILVENMIEVAKENGALNMTLEVRVSNQSAIALYEKYGFEKSGVRPKYYKENNEDALIMWKKL